VRQLALLAGCWLFYAGWGAGFLGVLVFSSVLNYLFGLAIRRNPSPARLWLGIATNLGMLVLCKYGTAVLSDASGVGALAGLVRPIGMSFWTLQALSYLFDTYREEALEPSLVEFCIYMSFAPTVLAGPISRLSSLLPQLRQPIRPTPTDISEGARRLLLGLFMKLVLADVLANGWGLAGGVNAGFDRLSASLGGLDVWFLAVGFGWQLYFDFAGYSHVVIGAARLLGVRLEENFDRPYLAVTPAAFWTRWHMSLSFWIRDYVFMPMTMMRRGRWWAYTSLVCSMVLCGVWHGATLPFIVWGAYHGILLVLHRVAQQVNRTASVIAIKIPPFISGVITFACVSIGWIFFRASTMSQAIRMCHSVLMWKSYATLSLPLSCYVLVLTVECSWLAVTVAEKWLDSTRMSREVSDAVVLGDSMMVPRRLSALAVDAIDYFSIRRWWWLVPILAVVGITGSVAFSDLGVSASRTPFMYTLF
jgi:D-alanyl-lipoteichoic acid acyltransferase DltB (MBOAT superfamily)